MLVDVQAGLLNPGRVAWDDPGIADAVTQAQRDLLERSRRAGIPVIHVGVRRPMVRGWLDRPRTEAAAQSGRAPRDVFEMIHEDDCRFLITPEADEEIVTKFGVSAFAGTALDAVLRNLGVDSVIIGGVFTHMAVESTVRAGFDLGYRMIVPTDASAAPTQALHEQSTRAMAAFGRLTTTEDAIEAARDA
ncbi:putative Isochorismatase family protein [Microbacterium sp. C448]|uniref:cysteine hydrolase family protein n=1 Tax=Microbacterium sp. C448 TaxID=1177594 RepID=UPI0003DE537D|nr:cysteine hydrolase [Microbacterium sp. C448]CDJ99075.1 putative Isochorismatase family protein [Microbacterium sp. C448]